MGSYTVKSGDNLSKIASSLGVSLGELIAANPQIDNPNLIFPNQTIRVPGRGEISGSQAQAGLNRMIAAGPAAPPAIGGRTDLPQTIQMNLPSTAARNFWEQEGFAGWIQSQAPSTGDWTPITQQRQQYPGGPFLPTKTEVPRQDASGLAALYQEAAGTYSPAMFGPYSPADPQVLEALKSYAPTNVTEPVSRAAPDLLEALKQRAPTEEDLTIQQLITARSTKPDQRSDPHRLVAYDFGFGDMFKYALDFTIEARAIRERIKRGETGFLIGLAQMGRSWLEHQKMIWTAPGEHELLGLIPYRTRTLGEYRGEDEIGIPRERVWIDVEDPVTGQTTVVPADIRQRAPIGRLFSALWLWPKGKVGQLRQTYPGVDVLISGADAVVRTAVLGMNLGPWAPVNSPLHLVQYPSEAPVAPDSGGWGSYVMSHFQWYLDEVEANFANVAEAFGQGIETVQEEFRYNPPFRVDDGFYIQAPAEIEPMEKLLKPWVRDLLGMKVVQIEGVNADLLPEHLRKNYEDMTPEEQGEYTTLVFEAQKIVALPEFRHFFDIVQAQHPDWEYEQVANEAGRMAWPIVMAEDKPLHGEFAEGLGEYLQGIYMFALVKAINDPFVNQEAFAAESWANADMSTTQMALQKVLEGASQMGRAFAEVDPDYSYTWSIDSEAEQEYLEARDLLQAQMGRDLGFWETNRLKERYENPIVEMIGEAILDVGNLALFNPVWEAMVRGGWRVIRQIPSKAVQLSYKAPLIGDVFRYFTRETVVSQARKMSYKANDLFGSIMTASRKDAGSFVQNVADFAQLRRAPSTIGRTQLKYADDLAQLIEMRQWENIADNAWQKATEEAIQAKMDAGITDPRILQAVTPSERRVLQMMSDTFNAKFLNDAKASLGDKLLLAGPTKISDALDWLRRWWIEEVLSQRPGFSMINLGDSGFRAHIIHGAKPFTSLDDIYRRLNNDIPLQLLDRFPVTEAAAKLPTGEIPKYGPLSYFLENTGDVPMAVGDFPWPIGTRPWFTRSAEGIKVIREEGLLKLVIDKLEGVPGWRGRLAERLSDLSQNQLRFLERYPTVGRLMAVFNWANFGHAWKQYNTYFEYAMSLRLYDHLYWRTFLPIDNAVGERLITNILVARNAQPSTIRRARSLWKQVKDNPAMLEQLISEAIYGRPSGRGAPIYSFLLPDQLDEWMQGMPVELQQTFKDRTIQRIRPIMREGGDPIRIAETFQELFNDYVREWAAANDVRNADDIIRGRGVIDPETVSAIQSGERRIEDAAEHVERAQQAAQRAQARPPVSHPIVHEILEVDALPQGYTEPSVLARALNRGRDPTQQLLDYVQSLRDQGIIVRDPEHWTWGLRQDLLDEWAEIKGIRPTERPPTPTRIDDDGIVWRTDAQQARDARQARIQEIEHRLDTIQQQHPEGYMTGTPETVMEYEALTQELDDIRRYTHRIDEAVEAGEELADAVAEGEKSLSDALNEVRPRSITDPGELNRMLSDTPEGERLRLLRAEEEENAWQAAKALMADKTDDEIIEAMASTNQGRIADGKRPMPASGEGLPDYAAREWLERHPADTPIDPIAEPIFRQAQEERPGGMLDPESRDRYYRRLQQELDDMADEQGPEAALAREKGKELRQSYAQLMTEVDLAPPGSIPPHLRAYWSDIEQMRTRAQDFIRMNLAQRPSRMAQIIHGKPSSSGWRKFRLIQAQIYDAEKMLADQFFEAIRSGETAWIERLSPRDYMDTIGFPLELDDAGKLVAIHDATRIWRKRDPITLQNVLNEFESFMMRGAPEGQTWDMPFFGRQVADDWVPPARPPDPSDPHVPPRPDVPPAAPAAPIKTIQDTGDTGMSWQIVTTDPNNIKIIPEFQPRLSSGLPFQVDPKRVDNYAANWDLKMYSPIKVNVVQPNDLASYPAGMEVGDMVLIGGHHRLEAAKRAGQNPLPIQLYQTTYEEANWLAQIDNIVQIAQTPFEKGRTFQGFLDAGKSSTDIATLILGDANEAAYVEKLASLTVLQRDIAAVVSEKGWFTEGHGFALAEAVIEHGIAPEVQQQIFNYYIKKYNPNVTQLREFLKTFGPKMQRSVQLGFGWDVYETFVSEFAATQKRIKELKGAARAAKTSLNKKEILNLSDEMVAHFEQQIADLNEAQAELERISGLDPQLPRTLQEAQLAEPPTPRVRPAPEPYDVSDLPVGTRIRSLQGVEGDIIEKLPNAPNGQPRYRVVTDDGTRKVIQGISIEVVEEVPAAIPEAAPVVEIPEGAVTRHFRAGMYDNTAVFVDQLQHDLEQVARMDRKLIRGDYQKGSTISPQQAQDNYRRLIQEISEQHHIDPNRVTGIAYDVADDVSAQMKGARDETVQLVDNVGYRERITAAQVGEGEVLADVQPRAPVRAEEIIEEAPQPKPAKEVEPSVHGEIRHSDDAAPSVAVSEGMGAPRPHSAVPGPEGRPIPRESPATHVGGGLAEGVRTDSGIVTVSGELLPQPFDYIEAAYLDDVFERTYNYYRSKGLSETAAKAKAFSFFEHQVDTANRAFTSFDTSKGFIVASGTGTGKTYAGALIVDQVFEKVGSDARTLIVAPNRQILRQWQDVLEPLGIEFRSIATKKGMDASISSSRRGVVYGTTYASMNTWHSKKTLGGLLSSQNLDLLIFDESHFLKNWYQDVSTALAGVELGQWADHVLYMSATPMESPLHAGYLLDNTNVFPTFDEMLEHLGIQRRTVERTRRQGGRTFTTLETTFEGVTSKKLATIHDELVREGRLIRHEMSFRNIFNKETGEALYMYSASVPVPISQEVAEMYNRFMQITNTFSPEGSKVSQIEAQRVGIGRAILENGKLDAAIELGQRKLAEDKTVAFFVWRKQGSQFEEHLSAFLAGEKTYRRGSPMPSYYERLINNGIEIRSPIEAIQEAFPDAVVISGDVTGAARIRAMDQFNQGKARVVICTIDAGGTGLSLHDTIGNFPRVQINLTVPYTALGVDQTAGRTFRFGSQSSGELYWLYADIPLEEKYTRRTMKKMEQMGALIGGEDAVNLVSEDELEEFLFAIDDVTTPSPYSDVPTSLAAEEFGYELPVDRTIPPWEREGWETQYAPGFSRPGDTPDLGLPPEQPVHTPGPRVQEDPFTAQMPVVFTRDMKQRLVDLGYSRDDIAKMTPQQAWDILNRETVSGVTDVTGISIEPEATEWDRIKIQSSLREGTNLTLERLGGEAAEANFDRGLNYVYTLDHMDLSPEEVDNLIGSIYEPVPGELNRPIETIRAPGEPTKTFVFVEEPLDKKTISRLAPYIAPANDSAGMAAMLDLHDAMFSESKYYSFTNDADEFAIIYEDPDYPGGALVDYFNRKGFVSRRDHVDFGEALAELYDEGYRRPAFYLDEWIKSDEWVNDMPSIERKVADEAVTDAFTHEPNSTAKPIIPQEELQPGDIIWVRQLGVGHAEAYHVISLHPATELEPVAAAYYGKEMAEGDYWIKGRPIQSPGEYHWIPASVAAPYGDVSDYGRYRTMFIETKYYDQRPGYSGDLIGPKGRISKPVAVPGLDGLWTTFGGSGRSTDVGQVVLFDEWDGPIRTIAEAREARQYGRFYEGVPVNYGKTKYVFTGEEVKLLWVDEIPDLAPPPSVFDVPPEARLPGDKQPMIVATEAGPQVTMFGEEIMGGEEFLSLDVHKQAFEQSAIARGWIDQFGEEARDHATFLRLLEKDRDRIVSAIARGDVAKGADKAVQDMINEINSVAAQIKYNIGDTPDMFMGATYIPLWMRPRGVRTQQVAAQAAAAELNAVIRTYDNWERWLLEGGADEMFMAIPEEDAQALMDWARQALEAKVEVRDVARYGTLHFEDIGPLAHVTDKVVDGALPETLRVMIDYATEYNIDSIMKKIFPFWKFPTRSIPFWLETISTHPELLSFWMKYQQMSERYIYQRGAVDSQGRPLNRLRGYVPVPGSDQLWFNPLSPLSAKVVMPKEYLQYGDWEDEHPEMGPGQSAVNIIYRWSRQMGFNLPPWWEWLGRGTGLLDKNEFPPRVLAPVIDMIPPWSRRNLIMQARKLHIWPEFLEDVILPEVGWKDYLIERDMLAMQLEEINNLLETNPEEATKIALATEQAMLTREGDPIWEKARRFTETTEYYNQLIGWFTGIYPKAYTDGEAELRRLRHEINFLRDMIDDAVGAEIFGLDPDQEARDRQWNERRYGVDEGVIYGLYSTISWTRTPTEGSLYGDRRREYVAYEVLKQIQRRDYFNYNEVIWDELQGNLEALGVGAPWEVKEPHYDTYGDQKSFAETSSRFELARRTVAHPGPGASPQRWNDWFVDTWMGLILSTKPQWDRENETYPEYKERVAVWEREIPDIAATTLPHFQRDATTLPADAVWPDLLAISNVDFLNRWDLENDTPLDALNRVWEDNYWDAYWETVEGLSGYQRDLAEMKFKMAWPMAPNEKTLINWVEQLYGNKYKRADLQRIIRAGVMDVEGRLDMMKSEEDQMADQIWLWMSWVGPSKSALERAFWSYGGDPYDWDRWWSSDGDPSAFDDEEAFNKFFAQISAAANSLQLEQPSQSTLEEWAYVQDLHSEYKSLAAVMFGENIFVTSTQYNQLPRSERAAFRAAHPELPAFWDFRDQYAVDHPLWAKYHNPSAYTGAAGGGLYSGVATGSTTGAGRSSGSSGTSAARGREPTIQTIPTLAARTSQDVRELLERGVGRGRTTRLIKWPVELLREVPEELVEEVDNAARTGGTISSAANDYLEYLKQRNPEEQEFIEGLQQNLWIPITQARAAYQGGPNLPPE